MLLRALFLSTIAPLVLAGTNEFGRQFLAKKAAEQGVVSAVWLARAHLEHLECSRQPHIQGPCDFSFILL